MPRLLIPKREWLRYLTPSEKILDESGWPVHREFGKRLRQVGFDPSKPIECDFVPGTQTLRLRQ